MFNLITTSVVTAFFLTAATTTIPVTHDSVQNIDQEKTLDEIITEGPINPEFGPQTGEFLFRPILYLKPHSTGRRVRQIDFYFSPVEENVDGVASLYSHQLKQRYRVSVRVPLLNPTGTNFRLKTDRIDLGTHTLDLPGGTYVLTEIRYSLRSSRGINFTSSPAATVSGSRIDTARSYCLTEETYAFDIQNGETKFLGGMAVNELASNPARWKEHFPIIGVDNRLELVSGKHADNTDNIIPIDFDLLAFEAGPKLCGSRQYQVSALGPK